mmetsp:Transcript_24635/g.55497  ORF Transcript_24635/g.55497 Transcript_24635/m.55497 type:complete len:258 (+) Transcript_24635:127-900(+)|eukprot:CAMPEP_0172618866 /NCGR_PEP_ID=MMETSP1068-20121228/87057_1 /TAXON_ID=35684 /ORGANISM="Pseudopedinella elastica, Strain CCMP716" /LENGTH=257 /DNA_ID=CAMNT_0013425345 /DNA_START=26 /DNA_END=799 /DNA_ORIENTATION=+
MPLSKYACLVTGAASGLGKATAERIIRQGGRCVLVDLPSQETLLQKISAELGSSAKYSLADICDPEDMNAALDLVESSFGTPVNTTVNCAGIAVAARTVSTKGPHSLSSFAKVVHVNTVGTFNVIRLSADRMSRLAADADGQRGVIINTASIAAFDGQIGQAAYAASKGAIASMTLPIARDLARQGTRVITIAPGLFKTPLLEGLPDKVQRELALTVPNPSRLGEPKEFAHLVQAIIENHMLNGDVIRLDGAHRLPP